MTRFTELFEKHKKGILDDAGISELHLILRNIYFHSKDELNEDELEYTEDLIFQLYTEKTLKEPYIQQFKEILARDTGLGKKYFFQRDLTKAYQSDKNRHLKETLHPAADDENEEAKLREVLQEVFHKVHAEKESTTIKDVADGFVIHVKNVIQSLAASGPFNQPWVRWIVAVASIVFIAGAAWLFIRPESPGMGASNSLKHQGRIKQPVLIEKSPIQKDDKTLTEEIHKKINHLLTKAFEYPTTFKYSLTRSETTSAIDSFTLAADKYNEKEYDNCRIILKELLRRNSFSDPDTVNEIYFFHGSCCLIRGIRHDDDKLLKLSLQSFQRINHQNPYYFPSKWYSVFAYLKMGQTDESLRLCDTLISVHFMPGKVKLVRDSIQKIIDIKPE